MPNCSLKMTLLCFPSEKKRETAGAPVSGSSGVQRSGSSNHPALLSLGSFVSAQQQPDIAYAAMSLGGNAELTKPPLFSGTACTSGQLRKTNPGGCIC